MRTTAVGDSYWMVVVKRQPGVFSAQDVKDEEVAGRSRSRVPERWVRGIYAWWKRHIEDVGTEWVCWGTQGDYPMQFSFVLVTGVGICSGNRTPVG